MRALNYEQSECWTAEAITALEFLSSFPLLYEVQICMLIVWTIPKWTFPPWTHPALEKDCERRRIKKEFST